MKFLFFSGHAHLALDLSATKASGGAELQVALLARELVARGHDVVLLGADTGQRDGVLLDGIKVRTGGRFDTGKMRHIFSAVFRIVKVLLDEQPDYLVVYGWTSLLYLLAKLPVLIKSLRYRLLFICALDSEIDGKFRRDHPLRGALFERGMYLCNARLAITEHQAKLFRTKGMTCSVTRLLISSHGSHLPNPPMPFAKAIDLLWVARCQPVKQPMLFLDLAEQLPQKRCQMICSSQNEILWKRVRERALRLPNVEFIEAISYHHIQDYFNNAKIFVNTSLDEGVPNTFIHAGLGQTAIASLLVNPDKMFEYFNVGICADNDLEVLKNSIVKLLDDPLCLVTAQQEAARFVTEWHDNKKNVEAFLIACSAKQPCEE